VDGKRRAKCHLFKGGTGEGKEKRSEYLEG